MHARPRGQLPDEVQDRVDRYLLQLDRDLPGTVSACYVVGSLALGDFSNRFSNIDLVVVSAGAWEPPALQKARAAETHLERAGRPPAVALVSAADLLGPPPTDGVSPTPADRLLTPLTWHLIRYGAPALRGPIQPEVYEAEGDLERWATAELHTRWARWLTSVQRRPLSLWLKRNLVAPLLEVNRLFTASEGQVLSKSDAAVNMIEQLAGSEGKQRILRDALAYRDGAQTSLYWGPLERKRHALALFAELTGGTGRPRPRPAG